MNEMQLKLLSMFENVKKNNVLRHPSKRIDPGVPQYAIAFPMQDLYTKLMKRY